MGRKEPVRNECEVIILNISNIQLRMWSQGSYDPHSYEINLWNCLYRSLQKVRTLTGFERMTSRQQCNALTNQAMKPLMLGACDLWVIWSP